LLLASHHRYPRTHRSSQPLKTSCAAHQSPERNKKNRATYIRTQYSIPRLLGMNGHIVIVITY
jgi:hypothetical protein